MSAEQVEITIDQIQEGEGPKGLPSRKSRLISQDHLAPVVPLRQSDTAVHPEYATPVFQPEASVVTRYPADKGYRGGAVVQMRTHGEPPEIYAPMTGKEARYWSHEPVTHGRTSPQSHSTPPREGRHLHSVPSTEPTTTFSPVEPMNPQDARRLRASHSTDMRNTALHRRTGGFGDLLRSHPGERNKETSIIHTGPNVTHESQLAAHPGQMDGVGTHRKQNQGRLDRFIMKAKDSIKARFGNSRR